MSVSVEIEVVLCTIRGRTHCGDVKRCFPSLSKVNLANGISKRMSELQIGDKVQSGMNFIYLDKIKAI